MMKCMMVTLAATLSVSACSELPTSVPEQEEEAVLPSGEGPTSGPSAPAAPPVTSAPSGAGMFAGARLWVRPDSKAAQQAEAWRTTRPADAALMDRVAAQPGAIWITEWTNDVRADVSRLTSQVMNAGALPVFVAYNIPVRDCNSYSAGGATSGSAYRSWIRDFAAGLAGRRAAVILEPDAIAAADCLSPALQEERYALIRDAVAVLTSGGAAVYIDAGHPSWLSASTAAARLQKAGVANAAGFALNVSNFVATSVNASYGASISALVGGKHFVIDTSRNGRGAAPGGEWCNPDGRGLGEKPTTQTGHPLVDALLWVKVPGESDGECNGGPHAGQWFASYALGLAQRAVNL